MSAPEALRIALEAAIAALLAVVALRLATTARREPAPAFLAAFCGVLGAQIVLNALAGAGVVPGLRAANFFLDLTMPALLLGMVARSGPGAGRLRRADAGHLVAPAAGTILLLAGARHGPDAWMLAVHTSYLAATAWAIRRRREPLRECGLFRLSTGLVAGLGTVLVLRIAVITDAHILPSYRDGSAYLMVLLVVLAMAAAVVAWMLREPRVSADDPGTVSPGLSAGEAHDIERRLLALLDAERLFLEPGLTLGAVARRLKVSPRQLSQAISARSGENFRGLVNRKRAQHAAHALGDPTVSITAVMFDAGFGSKSAFQREFRRCHGVSPSEFRQRLSRETGSS